LERTQGFQRLPDLSVEGEPPFRDAVRTRAAETVRPASGGGQPVGGHGQRPRVERVLPRPVVPFDDDDGPAQRVRGIGRENDVQDLAMPRRGQEPPGFGARDVREAEENAYERGARSERGPRSGAG